MVGKWRVLEKNGSGKNGTVKLVSGSGAIGIRFMQEISQVLGTINDLSTYQVKSGTYGYVEYDYITGTTSGQVNLLNYFLNSNNGNCYKYFDSSLGIHGLGCNTNLDGTVDGSNTEIEDLYRYITGENKTPKELESMSSPFSDSNLLSVATKNGKNWGNSPRWLGMLTTERCAIGGAPRVAGSSGSASIWSMNAR